jgi:SIR2-like domain
MPIKRPTVLVLGAGASIDYDFPSGDELLAEIYLQCLNESGLFRGFIDSEERTFLRNLIDITPTRSIDALLERHPDAIRIGKRAIALTLLPRESLERLYDVTKRAQSWYQYLWDCIQTPSFDDLIHQNNLSIVTYNYDRSLDYYLRISMKSSYNKSDEEIEQVMSQIPLIHLHGQLGTLDEIPYGTDIEKMTADDFPKAFDGIKIIHEADPNAEAFFRAKTCLKSAMQIIFLGFGFHQTNIDRLLCPECYDKPKYATAFGFTIKEMSLRDQRLHGCELKGMKTLQFLRETCLLET